ncbi:MAG: RHS repeat-associated core domain-containing protein, partial [Spirochaetaceae bacterium]|nr:RHS repeat-associated core domain-containing protein [Spirochaetaceae bacterium]
MNGCYTGKKIDRDTGLYYFNARWYDAELGRFITEDPIKDGINWFGYANQNPLTFIDPTGLAADDYQYSNMMSGNSDGSDVTNDNTYSYGDTSDSSGSNSGSRSPAKAERLFKSA